MHKQIIAVDFDGTLCEDGKKVGMIRIRDIKYIEPVELHCKHYIPDTGVNIR